MKSKNIYPYPIIGEELDFPGFIFSGEVVSYSHDIDNYNFEVKYELNEPNLLKLIETKEVVLVTTVSNSSLYRCSFKHFDINTTHKIKIPIGVIRGKNFKIEFSFKLCANKKFVYNNPSADKIYSGLNFNMEPGQLLGQNEASDEEITLEQGFASFHSSNSFLRIRRGEDLTETKIIVAHDIVSVYLTTENHKLFEEAQKNLVQSLLAIIVFPVIIELVHRVKKDPVSYSDANYLWVGVLKEKFGTDPPFDDEDNCLVIAEKILLNPWFKALQEVNVSRDMIKEINN